jgi:hypothetical protein
VGERLGAVRGAGCRHRLEQHGVRTARVATVILRGTERSKKARDGVGVVSAIAREPQGV